MGFFRKQSNHSVASQGSPDAYTTTVAFNKTVKTEDGSSEVDVVELKRVPIGEYAKRMHLPHTEDYLLKDLLAAGLVPEQVNVSGILDPTDPTDSVAIQGTDVLLDRLVKLEPKKKEPEQPIVKTVVEPSAPIVDPNVEPTKNND